MPGPNQLPLSTRCRPADQLHVTYNPTCDEAQVLSVFCTPYPNILYFPYAQVKTVAKSSSLPRLPLPAGLCGPVPRPSPRPAAPSKLPLPAAPGALPTVCPAPPAGPQSFFPSNVTDSYFTGCVDNKDLAKPLGTAPLGGLGFGYVCGV